jgi:hypothetical protein
MAAKTIMVENVEVRRLTRGWNAIIRSGQDEVFTRWYGYREEAEEALRGLGKGVVLNIVYEIKNGFKNFKDFKIVGRQEQEESKQDDGSVFDDYYVEMLRRARDIVIRAFDPSKQVVAGETVDTVAMAIYVTAVFKQIARHEHYLKLSTPRDEETKKLIEKITKDLGRPLTPKELAGRD